MLTAASPLLKSSQLTAAHKFISTSTPTSTPPKFSSTAFHPKLNLRLFIPQPSTHLFSTPLPSLHLHPATLRHSPRHTTTSSSIGWLDSPTCCEAGLLSRVLVLVCSGTLVPPQLLVRLAQGPYALRSLLRASRYDIARASRFGFWHKAVFGGCFRQYLREHLRYLERSARLEERNTGLGIANYHSLLVSDACFEKESKSKIQKKAPQFHARLISEPPNNSDNPALRTRRTGYQSHMIVCGSPSSF